jgi:photosystem II Psb28-2 protein
MTSKTPSIQFFSGVFEELNNVSLRRNLRSGNRIIVMLFKQVKALNGLNSFTKQSLNSMLLTDEEGEIRVTPSSTQFIFGGAEGDELQRVECKFEIEQDEQWQRFMRFMQRYAEANGLAYGES